jgi:hypothetical protein
MSEDDSSEASIRLAADGSLETKMDAADASLTTRLSSEEVARGDADTSLQTRLSDEEDARGSADSSLQVRFSDADSVEASIRKAKDDDLFDMVTAIYDVQVLNANTTLGDHTHVVAGADNLTFTLPTGLSNDSFYYIKNFSGVDASLTIAGNGKNVDGQSSVTLNVPNSAVKVAYDSATDAWYIY